MPLVDKVNINNISEGLLSLVIDIDSVTPDPENARDHPTENMKLIKKSLTDYSQTKPIVVRKSNRVIQAGNGTWKAAKELGWTKIAANFVDFDDVKATDYGLVDNRAAELAKWNMEVLARLDYLRRKEGANGEGTLPGWSDEDLKNLRIMEWTSYNPETDPFLEPGSKDESTVEDDKPTRTKLGEIWEVEGGHRIAVGDCTDTKLICDLFSIEYIFNTKGDLEILDDEYKPIDICFTSPPYSGQRDYDHKLGSESIKGSWTSMMMGCFENIALFMKPNAQVLVNLGMVYKDNEWVPYWDNLVLWSKSQGWKSLGWYVWDQLSGVPGALYDRLAPSHEFIFHFGKEGKLPNKFVRTKSAGSKTKSYGLRKTDGTSQKSQGITKNHIVQDYKISDSVFRVTRNKRRGASLKHPAVFSIELVTQVIRSFGSKDGGVVYDPFLGSGTSILGARHTGRKCYGCEISPKYADVALEVCEEEGLKVKRMH